MKFFEKLTLLFLIVLSCHLNARSAPDGNDSVTGVLTSDSKTVLPIQENRVHKAGLFWLNVTNNGYFGNPEGFIDPCTGLEAVRASMPGGSGQEYMFVSGLMFGGYLESDTIAVKTEAKAFEGPLVTTAFEDWSGNPMPRECWPIGFEDDPDGTVKGKIIETSNIQGKVSCLMQDVYDPSATANEQFSTWFSDKYVNRYYATGMDDYDKREHIPLGVEVKQKTYAWSSTYAEKFIIVDYTVYNKNEDGKDIYDFFMGIFSDFDVGINSREWTYFHSDDVGGFVHKWDKYIDPATGENKTVDLDIAWTADNDGRNYTGSDYFTASGEPSAGEPLNGAKGVIGIKVLKNPDPELKYSFNVFNNNSDESYDWGPRWKTGLHSDWKYDMTPEQKGYDDTNKDSLYNSAGQFQYGGRTEGRPLGDKGKYMVMSNNEIDHSFLDMREVYLGVFEDPDYLAGTPYAQADKWRKWEMNGGSDYVDGSAAELNNLANGNDVRFMLSFGPLGEKTSINVAVDTDLDSIPDNYINKEVWKFAYGDSLKFTLVYLTGEYFNYSLEQDPNYDNINIIDLNDGLDKTLYEQGWYDIFNSSVWVERIYDTPLFDTPVTKNGITKGDGWYGEDVGKDGLFADLNSGNMCWWLNEPYPGVDEGEGDNELTVFNSPNPDIYGWTAASEDDLLPYGNQDLTADFGSVVKYTKTDGLVPVNSMVRYGFDNKRLDSGDGVPDLQGPQAPPSPDIIVEKTAEEIIISWSSHQKDSEGNYLKIGSEHSIDNFSRINDFEGYKIMVSSEGDRESFISLFSIDKVNYSYQNISNPKEYLDYPIETDNPDTMEQTIFTGGKVWQLVPFMQNNSIDSDLSAEGYCYHVEKDSSQILTAGIVKNYTVSLNKNILGPRSFVAVCSMDFGEPKYGVEPQSSDPTLNAVMLSNIVKATANDPSIVPNPIRGDKIYTPDEWSNVADPSQWNEGSLVSVFIDIPENCVIRIYTLSGDLVRTVGHDGGDFDIEHKYKQVWDLKNDNGDIVASGIYLFSVQDADNKKDDFISKFVVIR